MATGTRSECGVTLLNISLLSFFLMLILAIIIILSYVMWRENTEKGNITPILASLVTFLVLIVLGVWCCVCIEGVVIFKKWKRHNSTVIVVQEVTQV